VKKDKYKKDYLTCKVMNLLFILYNILEIKNGVSNKYIQFIKYLESSSYIDHISIILTEIHNPNYQDNFNNQPDFQKAKIYYVKGCKVPFYDKIKIPNVNNDLLNIIMKNQNYIVIFNGEFIWLYDRLLKFKENYSSSLLLFPTWHTDYEAYFQKYISIPFSNNNQISYLMKDLCEKLEKKYFQGIIVTGGYMEHKFKKYSEYVFNANELCTSNFKNFKIDNYQEKDVLNFIYCGRVSIEKNIDELFDLLEDFKMNPYKIHIIGDGPYLKNLQEKYSSENKIKNKLSHLHVHYYGEVDYSKIQCIYQTLDNRIFIMCSETETFGKSPMEAGLTGMPIFNFIFRRIFFL
jgi:glycosyltransferase involved in cell wall biosynthesis